MAVSLSPRRSTLARFESSQFDYNYLVSINIITCGIELCTSAAFCYLPPMLLEAGFSESWMSTIMALGPLAALVLLPIMGTLSDQCKSPYGRRKPFIFALCVGITISLILLPYSSNVAAFLGPILPQKITSVILLAFAVILLDFCSQVAYTPIESLLSDPCENPDQQNRSFTVFTFMLSIGGCFGYWVTAIDWSETRLGWYFGGQEHTLFAILLVTFVFTSTVSLLIIRDPQHTETVDLEEVTSTTSKESISTNGDITNGTAALMPEIAKRTSTTSVPNNNSIISTNHKKSVKDLKSSSFFKSPLPTMHLYPCMFIASTMPTCISAPIMDTMEAMRTMPEALKNLWISDFFACTAVMGFRLYFTDYVGEAIYHGNPNSEPGSVLRVNYEQGIRMATWGLFLHSLTSALYSIVLSRFITGYGTRLTFLFGMGIFTIMTGGMLYVSHVSTTILFAALTGFASATISTVPYTLLTSYHENLNIYYPDMDPKSAHLHGKGADIALLDSAYIMSEVVSSFFFGIIVSISHSTTAYIVCSFWCGLLACYTFLKVRCA